MWVVTSSLQRTNDRVVCADLNSVFGTSSRSVVVCLVVARVISMRRIVACDGDVLDLGIVVPVGHVFAVPVDKTTSPVNRTLSVAL